jgi:hypothetical protein
MANRAEPYGTRYTGWYRDDVTPAMKLYSDGKLVATVEDNEFISRLSQPPPGGKRVKKIFVTDDGKLQIDYEDEPEG